MVSVLSRTVDAAKGLVATGRNRPSFLTRSLRGQLRSLRIRGGLGRCSDLSPLRASVAGLARQLGPRASCSVTSLKELWPRSLTRLLCSPSSSPRLCGDLRHGLQVTIGTRSPGFGRGISCGLRGLSLSFLPQGAPVLIGIE